MSAMDLFDSSHASHDGVATDAGNALIGFGATTFLGDKMKNMDPIKQRGMRIVSCTITALSAACGGGGPDTPGADAASGIPQAAQVNAAPLTCQQLAGTAIPASAIGMATSGATVTSATAVAASGIGAAVTPAHCLVTGTIASVDTAAPKITFKLALPTTWNTKALMYGGGGFNGSVPNVVGNFPQAPTSSLTPLARGYAVFGSDSGHQANSLASQDGSFALNAEALRNFGGDALKKTGDVAVYLIKARYGSTGPTRSYFAGGSTGGREALTSIQRWPADWNGAIAWYPAWNDAAALLGGLRTSRALALPGAYPSSAKRVLVYQAAMQACDALDGVADELISNQQACNAIFDPATATYNGAALRCPNGADYGDLYSCLSDAQITALKAMNTTTTFNFSTASGETQYPGFNVWGSDLGISSINTAQENLVTALALGWVAPAAGNPMPSYPPYISQLTDQWVKYFVTGSSASNSLAFDPQNPGIWASRVSDLSLLLDTKTDISGFVNGGGKLLLAHGVHDVLVSARGTEQYYQRLQAQFGAGNVGNFARFYEVPGFGHSASTTFNAAWDSLTALEQWAENNVAPANQVVTDSYRTPTRSRPLCDYPKWPKYKGSGASTLATSFTCVLN